MATTFQESYIDVERAYSQGQFQQALSLAEDLLTNRPADADDRQYSRLQLLTGHINLYGLKQPEKAASYYSQVVELSNEPTYRDLARQGLELCIEEQNRPAPEVREEEVTEKKAAPAEPAPSIAPFLTTAVPTNTSQSPAASAAAPWLNSGMAAAVDKEEEIELIELPEEESAAETADPTILEVPFIETTEPEPEVTPEPVSAFSSEDLAELAKGRLRVILG